MGQAAGVAPSDRQSGHRRRVKHRQLIIQAPPIGEGFLTAAGDIKNKPEQLLATSSIVSSPVAIVPALISIKSYQRFASSVRVAILMTGTATRIYTAPRRL